LARPAAPPGVGGVAKPAAAPAGVRSPRAMTDPAGKGGPRLFRERTDRSEADLYGEILAGLAEDQVVQIFAATNGYLDDVPVDKVRAWELEFHRFMQSAHPEILDTIMRDKALSDATIATLKTALDEFKRGAGPRDLHRPHLCHRRLLVGRTNATLRCWPAESWEGLGERVDPN